MKFSRILINVKALIAIAFCMPSSTLFADILPTFKLWNETIQPVYFSLESLNKQGQFLKKSKYAKINPHESFRTNALNIKNTTNLYISEKENPQPGDPISVFTFIPNKNIYVKLEWEVTVPDLGGKPKSKEAKLDFKLVPQQDKAKLNILALKRNIEKDEITEIKPETNPYLLIAQFADQNKPGLRLIFLNKNEREKFLHEYDPTKIILVVEPQRGIIHYLKDDIRWINALDILHLNDNFDRLSKNEQTNQLKSDYNFLYAKIQNSSNLEPNVKKAMLMILFNAYNKIAQYQLPEPIEPIKVPQKELPTTLNPYIVLADIADENSPGLKQIFLDPTIKEKFLRLYPKKIILQTTLTPAGEIKENDTQIEINFLDILHLDKNKFNALEKQAKKEMLHNAHEKLKGKIKNQISNQELKDQMMKIVDDAFSLAIAFVDIKQ
jgi:hypothetical protein